MSRRRIEIDPLDQLAAAALAGDLDALTIASQSPQLGGDSRLAPALALRARQAGMVLDPARREDWAQALRVSMVHVLQFDNALQAISRTLERAEVAWLPIKGNDLGWRVYQVPEERPCFDIDILVAPADLERACRALEQDGWTGLWGESENRGFLAEEGYCWMALSPERILVEVHFRLWGMVAEGLVEEILASAEQPVGAVAREDDNSEPSIGLRATFHHAFVVAACHLFQSAPPRGPLSWWDLERISTSAPPGFKDGVIDVARRWDLQLPVALAALYTGELWHDLMCSEIGERLSQDLRCSERVVARKALGRGVGRLPLSRLVLARLLARRRSRSGWLGLRRRVWAHPGIVARATPESWPWVVRRMYFLAAKASPAGAPRLRASLERRYSKG